MDYHEIVLKGPFYIEEVTSLPTASEKKRMAYYNGSIYYNNGTTWKAFVAASDLTTTLAGYSLTSHTHAYLEIADNLSDLANAATARTNLGLGTAAVLASTDFATDDHVHDLTTGTYATTLNLYLEKSDNLSDLGNVVAARTNLGLGTAALLDETDISTNSHNHDTSYTKRANNLSDVANVATTLLNLGLGNNAKITYTFSSGNPTMGNNGDVWYVPED